MSLMVIRPQSGKNTPLQKKNRIFLLFKENEFNFGTETATIAKNVSACALSAGQSTIVTYCTTGTIQ